jgi:hypothetical protein
LTPVDAVTLTTLVEHNSVGSRLEVDAASNPTTSLVSGL